VTPASAALSGTQTQQFTADQAVTWSASAGTITSGGLYTPPNVTGSYTVTARNASAQTTTVAVVVTGVFPAAPSWTYSAEQDKKVLVFRPESGPRQTRAKRAKSRRFDLTANHRSRAEYLKVESFWDAHYPNKNFYFTHPDLKTTLLVFFDAKLKEEWVGENLVNWSTVIEQV
jgi:phage-related protein